MMQVAGKDPLLEQRLVYLLGSVGTRPDCWCVSVGSHGPLWRHGVTWSMCLLGFSSVSNFNPFVLSDVLNNVGALTIPLLTLLRA